MLNLPVIFFWKNENRLYKINRSKKWNWFDCVRWLKLHYNWIVARNLKALSNSKDFRRFDFSCPKSFRCVYVFFLVRLFFCMVWFFIKNFIGVKRKKSVQRLYINLFWRFLVLTIRMTNRLSKRFLNSCHKRNTGGATAVSTVVHVLTKFSVNFDKKWQILSVSNRLIAQTLARLAMNINTVDGFRIATANLNFVSKTLPQFTQLPTSRWIELWKQLI